MGKPELIMIAVGLGMDAFAISICKGLQIKKLTLKDMLIVGLYFGGFQALMPMLGYLFGFSFHEKIEFIDHWITLILLSMIGINMIRGDLSNDEGGVDDKTNFKTMIVLAIATSLDALAVGVTFAFLDVSLISSISIIGIITFILCIIGVKIGHICGAKHEKTSCIFGGIILILLGIKILLEHLHIINF